MKNHPHPGELLREDVLVPLGIEVTDAAHPSVCRARRCPV
jgi:antitoxin HigA-1